MSFSHFSGRTFTHDEFRAYVAGLRWTDWHPQGITLHNTGAPTLAQWVESGPLHEQRIVNLRHYYEGMGWHAGPAAFVSRTHITEFSGFLEPGVHSTCFNRTHIGIEMAGDFSTEAFDSGDGALVRDTAVFTLATLYHALGLDPRGLTFHRECVHDHHDCPGKHVDKADVVARVLAAMGLPAQPDAPPAPVMLSGLRWVQDALNRLYVPPKPLAVTGIMNAETEAAVRSFQRKHPPLGVDGIPGAETIKMLKQALGR